MALPLLVACSGLEAAGDFETDFKGREFQAENRGAHELQRYHYY